MPPKLTRKTGHESVIRRVNQQGLICCGAVLLFAAPIHAADTLPESAAPNALAATISRVLESAIPLEYDKQKDWGATKEIPLGLRTEGKGLKTRLKTRKRAVNHGVWKHYRLRLIEPERNLTIQLAELRPVAAGRVAFTLHVGAKLDAWARAKVYEYGVHLIALEMESDLRVRMQLRGELGIELRNGDDGTCFAVAPVIHEASLAIDELNLRRVSNAHGPIVHELGDGVRSLVEDELNGPKLVEKLNRAIEKSRDRLTFRPAELLETRWAPWAFSPLGAAVDAAVAPAVMP